MPDDRLTGRQYLAEVERGAEASRQKGVRLVNEREGGRTRGRVGTGAVRKGELHGVGSMLEMRECGGKVVRLGRRRCEEGGASLSPSLQLPT